MSSDISNKQNKLQIASPNHRLSIGTGIAPAGQTSSCTLGTPFTDKGGLKLASMQVALIFWGQAWGDSAMIPSAHDVYGAIEKTLSGSYLSRLSQYGWSGPGTLIGGWIVNELNPPNIFTTLDVANFVFNMIRAGTGNLPDSATNPELVYLVVMPPGATNQDSTTTGEHTSMAPSGHNVHFGWVTNKGNGDLNYVTQIASHELAECITDPEGSGIKGNDDPQHWCEIGDVCEGTFRMVDGVSVQAYWSQQDGACWPQ